MRSNAMNLIGFGNANHHAKEPTASMMLTRLARHD